MWQNWDKLEKPFLNIWTLQPSLHSAFKTLFCSRNVKMIQDAHKKELAWDLYARLVGAVMDKQIIELDELESQCTGFYNKNWDSVSQISVKVWLFSLYCHYRAVFFA